MHPTRRSFWALLFLFVLSFVAVRPALTQGGGNNPGVIPPHAKYRGLTYGEWQSRYWQAMFAIPVVDGKHPFLNFGAFGGDDGVVFLTPSYGQPGSTTVDVTMASGKALFVPVWSSVECSQVELAPFYGADEATLRQCANDFVDTFGTNRAAWIDGHAVKNVDSYRSESPLFSFGPLPENNILQFFGFPAPPGTTSLSVAAGYYLLIAPLSVGSHEVRVSETGLASGNLRETVYRITVVPAKK